MCDAQMAEQLAEYSRALSRVEALCSLVERGVGNEPVISARDVRLALAEPTLGIPRHGDA